MTKAVINDVIIVGARATYICAWITSVAHFHLLFGSFSCGIWCHDNDAGKIKGGCISFSFLTPFIYDRWSIRVFMNLLPYALQTRGWKEWERECVNSVTELNSITSLNHQFLND